MQNIAELLGCRHPVIQGAMGVICNPEMVAAVSEAGGFGMLALGFASDPDPVRQMVREIREKTDKPFGANLMIMNPANDAILDALAEAGVKTVTTSAGSPKTIYPKIHERGMRGLHVALALRFAVKAAEAGADGVVVSGLESGGLRSVQPESSNMVLIPLVCDHVGIPVVAAGGIADRRGYRAALALGAEGVQIGTRFLAAAECPSGEAWKRAIIECGDGGTTLLPQGSMSMRVIVNAKLAGKMMDASVDLASAYSMMNAGTAWRSGDFDLFPAGAGQVSAVIRDVLPVRDIIEEMVS